MSINLRKTVQTTVEAEHRDGKGNLIARSVSIQEPGPLLCTRPSCMWEFWKDSVLSALLSTYHARRVSYAEKKRHKKIPDKYRTGSPSPETIGQAIWAIIKLRLRR